MKKKGRLMGSLGLFLLPNKNQQQISHSPMGPMGGLVSTSSHPGPRTVRALTAALQLLMWDSMYEIVWQARAGRPADR
jgi:hypothetical protein